jgi:hypothetical protein
MQTSAGSQPSLAPDYDFQGACFDLEQPTDRHIVGFILSQALYGEATGVYCGKSLYAAHSLEAARFYLKQARQELGHLQLFAEIFRSLSFSHSLHIGSFAYWRPTTTTIHSKY